MCGTEILFHRPAALCRRNRHRVMHYSDLRRPALLVILDGFGVNPGRLNNAVQEARTPNLDRYFAHHPHTVLKASGRAVGVPEEQMGNSEVGHMALGGGTVVRQYLALIDDAIADGSFFDNPSLVGAAQRARDGEGTLHLLGMVSDGGVHSHYRHLVALIDLCRRHGVEPRVHMITDGRDTAPQAALEYVKPVQEALKATGGRIATVTGRYYAMDRDNRWQRTREAWAALIYGEGRSVASARDAILAAYEGGETDEFMHPMVIDHTGIGPGEPIVFFNFRADRPRQLTAALSQGEFHGFDRGEFRPRDVTTMTQYDENFGLPYAFAAEYPATTLGEVVSAAGLRQFRCAETEKYAHVTYFLNGGREQPFAGEDRVMVPSSQLPTYDLVPEMSAPGVAREVVAALNRREYALVVVNFANGDMVGHTAIREAVIAAVEVLDREVGRVLDAAVDNGYSVVLTADHGNCEEMVDPATGLPHTQHTVYPVPCLVIDREAWRLSTNAGLSAVTPTLLELMGLEKPESMTGQSLLRIRVTRVEASA